MAKIIGNESKPLAGYVTISRASGGPADAEPIHITIDDEISGCRVLDLYMRLDEFAKAVTSSQGKASIRHFRSAPVGMKAENKTEIVPYKHAYGKDHSEDEAKALGPFEVDGWRARRSDLSNHHHYVSEGKQRVTFFRHVNPDTGEPVIK